MRIRLSLALTVMLCVATPIRSHDFWLVPLAFQIAPDAELVVLGQTSSDFPATLSAVTPDRIVDARIVGARSERPITALSVSGNSLRLSHRPREAGQAIVAARILPRTVRESPESFRRYLTLEGAPEALVRYERAGILPTDSITRRYAKYAKSLVQVGDGGPSAFSRVVGHPLEFVPLTDPTTTAQGGATRFRMLFNGAPLAHARGHASAAGSVGSARAFHEVEFETNEAGEFSLVAAARGLWNVRALHIVPAPANSGADWDVHWATLVWESGSR